MGSNNYLSDKMNNKKPKIVSNLWRQYEKSWVRWELRDDRGGEEVIFVEYLPRDRYCCWLHALLLH